MIVYSAELGRDLATHGMIPRRTQLNVAPPSVPDEYERDFVRGVIDGDGWVTRAGKVRDCLKGWSIGVTGSPAVVMRVVRYAVSIGLRPPEIAANGSVKKVSWHGPEALRLILDLYRPGDLALSRKAKTAAALRRAVEEAYPSGVEQSMAMQAGKLHLTDHGRVRSRRAAQYGRRAVEVWRQGWHPSRGKRRECHRGRIARTGTV